MCWLLPADAKAQLSPGVPAAGGRGTWRTSCASSRRCGGGRSGLPTCGTPTWCAPRCVTASGCAWTGGGAATGCTPGTGTIRPACRCRPLLGLTLCMLCICSPAHASAAGEPHHLALAIMAGPGVCMLPAAMALQRLPEAVTRRLQPLPHRRAALVMLQLPGAQSVTSAGAARRVPRAAGPRARRLLAPVALLGRGVPGRPGAAARAGHLPLLLRVRGAPHPHPGPAPRLLHARQVGGPH